MNFISLLQRLYFLSIHLNSHRKNAFYGVTKPIIELKLDKDSFFAGEKIQQNRTVNYPWT